jgi:hypothetical protein
MVDGSGDITTHVLYALLKADITVKDIQVKSGNLEDAFVKLTQTNGKTLKTGRDRNEFKG